MDACAGNVTDVCKIGQELLMSVRNFSQCFTKWRQVYVAEYIFSEDAVTTESGNEFQMCITLIEKKFERK